VLVAAANLVDGEDCMEWRSARQGVVIRANGIHGFKPARRSESNQLATQGPKGREAMSKSATQSMLSAILLGAMLAASAPVAADEVTDSSITSWVNEALRHDPLVPASEISVSTKEGIVTLSGRVDNLAAKNRVDRQASKIRGVREVLNELTVAPSSLSDADIVYAIRRRILNNATIVSQRIVVTSVDGNVTI